MRRGDASRRRSTRTAKDDPSLPLVALVGRPNVGKSSLFNRLVGGRPALVEDMPGVTRDRRYGVCEWNTGRIRICDTGGLDPSAEGILGAMRAQSLRAVEEAAVLVFVVDAQEGVSPVDVEVARVLRRSGKPVFVAVNKADSERSAQLTGEHYKLGFKAVFPVSATHGRGISDLIEGVMEALGIKVVPTPAKPPRERGRKAKVELEEEEIDLDGRGAEADEAEDEDGPRETTGPDPALGPIRLAFLGKPNAGKSSLVNRLLGEDRVLVHDQPGTTRDPIDTPFSTGGREFILVDTAGIRRRKVVKTLTEAVSAKMARDQVARADVVALVVDATLGATEEDARLASLVEESGRSLIVVLNKSDLVARVKADAALKATKERLSFVSHAPFVFVSAVTGRGVREIPAAAARAFDQWVRRVPTAELNRHFAEMVNQRPPPSSPTGKHVKLYFITQAEVAPPTFFVSANEPIHVGFPYRRYLSNQLRKIYGFEGAPIKLAVRAHKQHKKGDPRPGKARAVNEVFLAPRGRSVTDDERPSDADE